MCGICGIFVPHGTPVDPARVVMMREALAHRGPDGCGLSCGPGYVLGHRRLSILDLSDNGRQPMSNETGSVEVVFNGEIYNFLTLRNELQAKGHVFRSRTDTEVLLHGYEEWGIRSLLARIRGMYAFALVDRRAHLIHMARDPLGKKPLFFCLKDEELVFASSVRALVLGLTVSPEVDPVAIDRLLWNLYIPGPGTILQGVEKLPPGHALTVGRDGQRREYVHWQPDFSAPDTKVTDDEWIERIDDALSMAVKNRLVADVPVGILLSGGIDSSLVTAIAARSAGRVETFAVATEDPRLDESEFAGAVAKRYGTKHHVLAMRGLLRKDLPKLIAGMGEPLADASAANVFAVAQNARQFVSVVLTGDGGDEAFGGYQRFIAYYVAGLVSQTCSGWQKYAAWAANQINTNGRSFLHSAQTVLRLASTPLEQTLSCESMAMDAATRASLYTPEFERSLRCNQPAMHYLDVLPEPKNGASLADRVMQTHMLTVLPDDYLSKVDSGTMAINLEARSPFLDVNVVELAMKIPAASRFRRFRSKALLRRLARRYVPPKCVHRRKQGFVAPVGIWLRRDWPDLVQDFILGRNVEERGWFRRDTLQRLVTEHSQGIDHSYLLWGIMVLEIWLRMALEHRLDPADSL
jgi:asparagine synthase (glutamine-hydrolysing)